MDEEEIVEAVATGRTRFSGLNVLYDAEGNEYPVDEDGNLTLNFFY